MDMGPKPTAENPPELNLGMLFDKDSKAALASGDMPQPSRMTSEPLTRSPVKSMVGRPTINIGPVRRNLVNFGIANKASELLLNQKEIDFR